MGQLPTTGNGTTSDCFKLPAKYWKWDNFRLLAKQVFD